MSNPSTGDPNRNPQRRIQALEEENAVLRSRLEQRREADASARRRTTRFTQFLVARFVGLSVIRSASRLGEEIERHQEGQRATAPVHEAAVFGGAVVARVLRVGLIGLIVALVPSAFLAIQTWAIVEQNKKFDAQLDQASAQLEQARDADYETKKALLLNIIYDTERDFPWGPPVPRAPARVRGEAIKSYAALQARRDGVLDLAGAFAGEDQLKPAPGLSMQPFFAVDLEGCELSKVFLEESDGHIGNLSNFAAEKLRIDGFGGHAVISAMLGDASVWTRSWFVDCSVGTMSLDGGDETIALDGCEIQELYSGSHSVEIVDSKIHGGAVSHGSLLVGNNVIIEKADLLDVEVGRLKSNRKVEPEVGIVFSRCKLIGACVGRLIAAEATWDGVTGSAYWPDDVTPPEGLMILGTPEGWLEELDED